MGDTYAPPRNQSPFRFKPEEINPVSKKEAFGKYAGFGYDRKHLNEIYKSLKGRYGKENALKWMSSA